MIKSIHIHSTTGVSLPDQLQSLANETQGLIHLKVDHLSSNELIILNDFIASPSLSLTKLSLKMDLKTLQDPNLPDLLTTLNQTLLSRVEFVFPAEEIQTHASNITAILDSQIAPKVSFPLQIRELTSDDVQETTLPLAEFQQTIIANIQNKHKAPSEAVPSQEGSRAGAHKTERMAKKIRLKELIQTNQFNQENIDHYVPIEVQHVETVEQEVNVQEVLQVETDIALNAIQEYEGPLIDFAACSSSRYKKMVDAHTRDPALTETLYNLLKRELFANLPHGIKFLTPDATEQLMENLSCLATLNKDNLPHGFYLKQTKLGELVLDYDPYLENEQANAFTLKVPQLESEAIYQINFQEQDLKQWIDDQALFESLCYVSNRFTSPKSLTNLWIYYGNEGVKQFFADFKSATKANPEVGRFLLQNYLAYLPQWDMLYSQKTFLATLKKISSYDDVKWACLKKFLQRTGFSRYDLGETIIAFETFWTELNRLCAEKNAPIQDFIQAQWSTPLGGNPIVYMERMLCILKSARSLKEQFNLLNGICLDNYGAYYACRYEGLSTVASEMNFHYDPTQDQQRPFNINFELYRVNLEALAENYPHVLKYKMFRRWFDKIGLFLVNCEKPLPEPLNLPELEAQGLVIPFKNKDFVPPYQLYAKTYDKNTKSFTDTLKLKFEKKPDFMDEKAYYALCLRYIAMQNCGIHVESFKTKRDEYRAKFLAILDDSFASELLSSLFFVCHERYVETNESFNALFDSIERMTSTESVIKGFIGFLNQIRKLDIHLNLAEGLLLAKSIDGMNSCEFQSMGIDKTESIKKLQAQLINNKFAALKLFDFRNKMRCFKWPFIYALDTAEFLAADPIVAANYPDDLLLFSGMINSEKKEAYYHTLFKDETKKDLPVNQIILQNITKVREYFSKAATQEKPNNLQYAIQTLLNSKSYFNYTQFLNAFSEIDQLKKFDHDAVNKILIQYQFTIGSELPALFIQDNDYLKGIMISLIIKLESLIQGRAQTEDTYELSAELACLSIAQLQARLKEDWEQSGTLLAVAGQAFLNRILKITTELAIQTTYGLPEATGIMKLMGERISQLPEFQDYADFDKVNLLIASAEKIAKLLNEILKNPYVAQNEVELTSLFTSLDFSKINYESLHALLDLLTTMPQRHYFGLLKVISNDKNFIYKKETVLKLVEHLSTLNTHCFSSEYLEAFTKLVIKNSASDFKTMLEKIVAIYDNDPKDFLLETLLISTSLPYDQISQILKMTAEIKINRDKLNHLIIHLHASKNLNDVLELLSHSSNDEQTQIFEILCKAHSLNRQNDTVKNPIKYTALVKTLTELSIEELSQLYQYYQITPVSAACLLNGLNNLKGKKITEFLSEFEKSPFGKRDLSQQFSCIEVERVVNQSQDLINGSQYTRDYRQQLIESFLFVNEIGEKLPVFNGKAAKDLKNAEIKSIFADLKAKRIPNLTLFQSSLLGLALMREAMYRSTGEFAYSTQIIALIDAMMHTGDFISNIDTGQGKSLIDSMKAALLWLNSDRVELTTSSLVDAKRDIANYGPFFKLLDIPYSSSPISSSSPYDAFLSHGVNISTFAQLSLFYAKAKVTGQVLDSSNDVVSLVVNESDHAILDDRVIYRFATTDNSTITREQEWMYYAINEFVTQPSFIVNEIANADDDVHALKNFLRIQARKLNKSSKVIDKFSDSAYLTWLNSALMVNYILKENEHYVIPDAFEKKVINGVEYRSKVAKILMKDDKVSPDSTFGNGMQQLLYARLNKESGSSDFIIEPQNKTIISSNNKNLIDAYRLRKGYIWGSSGTVGANDEIKEQHRKYGFEFSKMAPHQKNKVKFHKPVIKKNEERQFKELIRQLTARGPSKNTAPSLVFCKDITTATRLFKLLESKNSKKFPIQLYTGLGKEEDYIRAASQPGMITITTAALGRNTDILYNRVQGLQVWHSSVDSVRGLGQKNGRTGRQGSTGNVHFILNAQELHGRTIEQVQQQLNMQASRERQENEEFYNILGYLLRYVEALDDVQFTKGKSDFLRNVWAAFSAEMETKFHEQRYESSYNEDEFLTHILATFHQKLSACIRDIAPIDLEILKADIHLSRSEKATYPVSQVEVKTKECTPPITIAYHLLQTAQTDENPEKTKADIKKQLSRFFAKLDDKSFVAKSRKYLQYLNSHPATQKLLIDTHQEFVTALLQKHAKKQNILHRWFGIEGKLKKLANAPNYLLMFHALLNNPQQSTVSLKLIQDSVTSLLDEYLHTSWYINDNRKKWATDLKTQISQATNIDAVIDCISNAQINTAKEDIAENKKRKLTTLHASGHSRFQTTLNQALNLACGLTGKTNVCNLQKGLMPLISEVTDEKPIENLTQDALMQKAASKKRDKANTAVLMESLSNVWRLRNAHGPIDSMIGRQETHAIKSI